MKRTTEQEILLRNAKRAVLLNRYSGISISTMYEELILKKECCDERFMCGYVRKHKLLEPNEAYFLKTYLKDADEKKLQLVQDYVVYHGAYPEGQVLIMQSKDVELIVALLSHYDINEDGNISEQALEALVQLKDAKLLHDVLKKHLIEQAEMHYNYPHCIWQTCYELTLKMQDVQTLKAFCALRFVPQCHFGPEHEKMIFARGTDEMVQFYLTQWKLFDETIDALSDERLNYAHWEDVLKAEIEQRPLTQNTLFYLVKKNKIDLLKLHYQKYGLDSEVMAYYANQKQFCKDLGIDG